MQSPSGSPPEARTDKPPTPPSLPDHLKTIEAISRRISTESLGESGIKSFRILNESRLRETVDRLVEERVRERLACAEKAAPPASTDPEGLKALREQYRVRWKTFRARYEEKLLRLEEKAARAGVARRSTG